VVVEPAGEPTSKDPDWAEDHTRHRKAGLEERQRLWPIITSKYSNYADYQKGITREIPVVILTPGP
jgi:hypothetical protein